ncbi:hypothetical protein N656DRAFT_651387 [Canariomyces notabilis]|uniref:Uncharacterized protein n=1 Tax=Canariomyces notabilis TaxID=2074819 RepID=A0AAN6YTD7_9PEZI|nr:hypothetical protein N656DRAFT_651387 [Canariomyces arenarius]
MRGMNRSRLSCFNCRICLHQLVHVLSYSISGAQCGTYIIYYLCQRAHIRDVLSKSRYMILLSLLSSDKRSTTRKGSTRTERLG